MTTIFKNKHSERMPEDSFFLRAPQFCLLSNTITLNIFSISWISCSCIKNSVTVEMVTFPCQFWSNSTQYNAHSNGNEELNKLQMGSFMENKLWPYQGLLGMKQYAEVKQSSENSAKGQQVHSGASGWRDAQNNRNRRSNKSIKSNQLKSLQHYRINANDKWYRV